VSPITGDEIEETKKVAETGGLKAVVDLEKAVAGGMQGTEPGFYRWSPERGEVFAESR